MITIKHNILHNKFRKILVSPKESSIPDYFFRKLETDKDDVITRSLDLSRFDESKRISLAASKVIEVEGQEHIRYYKFILNEEEGKSGSYKDDYISISTLGGNIVCEEASDFINIEEAQNRVIDKGWEDAKCIFDNMPDVSANSLYKVVFHKFLEKEYDIMASNTKYSILINSLVKLEILQLYANGIKQFIKEENLGIINNTQRLLDEVRTQIDLYGISSAEKYLHNCELYLKQCPDSQILKDAFVLWDKEIEFDFLWYTAHLDCRFSIGLDDTRWHMWVGINHHSSDDETYSNGVGGEGIDENDSFAYIFFDEMHYYIVERGIR